ncbi:ureidoglycolate lyase [Labrenzia sp. 011]|uniref:ureidoglycolate lyase n=1 Tax=Labrenzia sp. 011 TaxID=2171494 RepID=UPI000D521754|nr:ureidoglycolate lyase [Labrenzia sp. 011]PVB63426.1 Ureidoglycolate hydrolase [Labrenzia sp. 011]
MTRRIATEPLTRAAFAPFGEVIDASGTPSMIINEGKCGRYHDQAVLDMRGENARAGISVFLSEKRTLPYRLELVERHPLGSQAFLPMTQAPFLVIVCPDDNGTPGRPRAFVTEPGQGINLRRNTWHGVLTPLSDPGLFSVVDRIGDGNNLEEFRFNESYEVVPGH